MNKSSHFIGQPAYGQLINLLDKEEILEISRSNGGERYVKHFDAWQHLLIMLYAIINLDSANFQDFLRGSLISSPFFLSHRSSDQLQRAHVADFGS